MTKEEKEVNIAKENSTTLSKKQRGDGSKKRSETYIIQ
jgi:hypothetical protein